MLDLLDGIVESGRPVAANRTLTAIRKLFNWAMDRDIIATSPCAGVKPPTAEHSRDRVLSDDELRASGWRPITLGGPFAALVKLLLLTGQRRDEVADMTWSEVDLDARLWRLPPRAFQERQAARHSRSASPPSRSCKSLPRIGDTFVLTTNGTAPASSNYGANKKRLDAHAARGDMSALVAARSTAHDGVGHGAARRQPARHREGFEPLVGIVRRNCRRLSASRFCRRESVTRSTAGAHMSPIWFRVVAAGTSSILRGVADRHAVAPALEECMDVLARGGGARGLP